MKPVKRLRGHGLELAKLETEPLTKGDGEQSVLAQTLLSLWSHGQLSAKLVQDVAHKAILTGSSGHDLATIAKTGSHGSLPGNCHRDLCASFTKDCKISGSTPVETKCKDPKTSQVSMEKAGILLPHILFADLFHHYTDQFETLFGVEHLNDFWRGVEASQDDRLQGHPTCLDKRQGLAKRQVQDPETTIPIFIHADGVEFQSRDSLMIWNWGGFLNAHSSLTSHFLICAWPKSATVSDTWTPIMQWVRWSLEALQEGLHPCFGPDNEPLPKGSIFEQLAGQPLTGRGYRAVLWSIQGDQEMYSNVLHLPHWNSHNCCHACDAQQPFIKGKPCEKGKGFKELLPENQKFIDTDTAAALTKGSQHQLFETPGLTIRMVRQDGLHVLFVKGVCSHLLGSLLHHVCYNQGRGKQNKQPSQRLALIFSKIQENYKELQTPTRLTNLRLSMVCDPSKPHQEYAKLEAKGAETKHLLSAFLPVLKSILEPNNTLHQHMVGALEAMVDLVAAFDAAGLFPCPKEFQAMQDLDQRFCRHYTELNKWAQKNDHKLYHIVYKHHCQHHLVKEAQFLNPRYTWNFRSEDFVGRVATLARSLAMGVKSTRLSGKLMIKYRILLHMQLTRLGFDLGVSPDSDGEEW